MAEQNDPSCFLPHERQSRALTLRPGDVLVQIAHLAIADTYAERLAAARRDGQAL